MTTNPTTAPNDPFAALRDQTELVPVGGDVLTVRTARLSQDETALRLIGQLDLAGLGVVLAEALEKAGGLDASGGDRSVLTKMLPLVPALLPKLWEQARTVLGQQLIPCIRGIAIAMLDTRENARVLAKANIISPAEAEAPGAWKGSQAVQDHLLETLSTPQAARVVAAAFRVSNWREIVGNLLPLATAKAPGAMSEPKN